MSIQNLHHLLEARSVAVFGASERPGSLGEAVLRNLVAGGFKGAIWPVNPRHACVMGRTCLKTAADLPDVPDLALVATPPEMVAQVIAEFGLRGGKVAVVLTAGMDAQAVAAMLDAARPHAVRVIGPDSVGVMTPALGLNASVAHLPAAAGQVALISSSGAILTTLIDWAAERGLGFSHVVGLGEMADVDLGDYLDFLAGDGRTRAILMYLETVPSARKFLSAARAAARLKPVIALKPSHAQGGAPQEATHVGALADADAVADAALRRAGVLRVRGLAELFAAAQTVARFRPLGRARLAILTNGRGAGALAVDRLIGNGAELAVPSGETVAALDARLPSGWNAGAVVDLSGDAPPERYLAALEVVVADPGVDAVLVMNCPMGVSESLAIAHGVAAQVDKGLVAGKPLLACWLGGPSARAAGAVLRAHGVASYDSPATAAAAAGHLTEWGRAQAALLRVPDRTLEEALRGAPTDARSKAAEIFAVVAAEGRRHLTEPEALGVLAAYGVPVPAFRQVASPPDAGDVASDMLRSCRAVAVKVVSPDIAHKMLLGGVVLDVTTPQAAEDAAEAMEARIRSHAREARFDGFSLSPMADRPDGLELILGVASDPVFGPVLLFGAGGLAVELLEDTAVALPPLDAGLAAELVARTRVGRLLAGYAGRPAAQASALHGALVALSHMIEDFPGLRGVDINPLVADADGIIALDASMEIDPEEIAKGPPNDRLAIRPYPAEWRREVALKGGGFVLRPILPLDVLLYPAFIAGLRAEDVRMRFLAPRKHFPDEMGLRLTQLDYDRDMAFVALAPDGSLAGVARMACAPDRASAEYALVVRSDLAGQGVGSALLGQLIDYARADGVKGLEGMILAENAPMRGLVRRFGFVLAPIADEPGVVMSRLDL